MGVQRCALRFGGVRKRKTGLVGEMAILFIKDLRAISPSKPFFLYLTPGACHAPHHAPRPFIDRYRGRFDQGWDRWREEVYARQVASGLLPSSAKLTQRPAWIAAWDDPSDDARRLYA